MDNEGGKLLGIVPHQYEREVGFVAAVIGIVAFVAYQRSQAASAASAPASSGGVSVGASNGGQSQSNAGLTSNDGTVASQSDINGVNNNLNNIGGTVLNAINGIASSTSNANNPSGGASFALDLSVLDAGTGNNSYNQTSTKSSGSGGSAGLKIGGFQIGGGGSTSNSSQTTNSGGGEYSYNKTVNAIGSGSNLTESELNTIQQTLLQAQRTGIVSRDFQTEQAPPATPVYTGVIAGNGGGLLSPRGRF